MEENDFFGSFDMLTIFSNILNSLSSFAGNFTFVIIFIFNRLENIPRLVIVLNLFVMVFFTGGVRVFYRALSEKLGERPLS